MDAHGLLAKKSFGQHFLLDLNLTRKIVRLAGPLQGRALIEVGPGPGGLTRALLESDAEHVIAVEKDARFLPLLNELAQAAEGRLTLVQADALEADEAALVAAHGGGRPWRVVANLPYNVGTPLLVKWLTAAEPPEAMTLMFQKEVAERLVARPGEDAYGRLGVLTQAVARAEIVMDLPARAFTPPPKVDSAIVDLTLLPDRPLRPRLAALEKVTQAAFGQRRKMLRSSLKSLGGERLLESARIEPSARAEQIPVEGFLRLADALQSGSSSSA
jgi:16S rRNA (adenine1518-N6/adenine1519-N6)-dimethyltransferase